MSKNKQSNQSRIAEQKAIVESGRKQLKAIKILVTTIGVVALVLAAYLQMSDIVKTIACIFGAAMVYVGSLYIKDMDQQDIMKSLNQLTNDKDFMKKMKKMMK
jgi:hypothetical protein